MDESYPIVLISPRVSLVRGSSPESISSSAQNLTPSQGRWYPRFMKRKVSATINVPVRPQLRELVSAKIERSGLYSSAAEYVRDLIRKDVQRDAIEAVDQLLIDGLASGTPEPMTAAWRKARRTALAKHLRARKSARS